MEEKLKVKNLTLRKYLFTVTTFSKLLAMFLFILFPFIGFYLGVKYQERLMINNVTCSLTQNNNSLDIVKITPSNLDVNSYTAINNGITFKISPIHGKPSTVVKIDISGITDTNNLGIEFYDSQSDFSLQGLGIRATDVHGGRYTGAYAIPLQQKTPPTRKQQNGGTEVPTAKGIGSFNFTHGSNSESFISVPFIVD